MFLRKKGGPILVTEGGSEMERLIQYLDENNMSYRDSRGVGGIHFRLSPKDFDKVLLSQKFEIIGFV